MQDNHGEPRLGADFAARVEANQKALTSKLQAGYDFIVCGSGSSGAVVARRLAENADVSVLLLEAGGTDDLPQIHDAARWLEIRNSAEDWAFKTRPNPHLNGRSMPWAMGKVLGGSSSINAMAWARGHKNDWDDYARQTGDDGWSYPNVLAIYRAIEDGHGAPDPERRGSGGLLAVYPQAPSGLFGALVDSAPEFGMPTFADHNGRMMETDGGVAPAEMRINGGKRLSVFRSYTYPYMDRPNLTVLTDALVTRVIVEDGKAVGVEVIHKGAPRRFEAAHEVILSLGAIHTPKVLMQSGIGDAEELSRFGIEVLQHLPGVGRNLQDHILINACAWESPSRIEPGLKLFGGLFVRKSDTTLVTPDLQCLIAAHVALGPATSHLDNALPSWSIRPGLVRPKSVGRIHLTGPKPDDPVDIDANILGDPADVEAAMRGVQFSREIGNSAAFRPFSKREVLPGPCGRSELENFVRNAAVSFHHYAGTAKMGRDEMSVVDGALKVYGIDRLRVADG
ncbi:MAG: GMC family oxidoreductase N-terminal domain-containing protein, partial [Bradyrhizobium sp.]